MIARALPPEAIKMGGREVFADRYEADWSRQIKRLAVNVPKALDDWVLIYSAHKESLALQFATLAAEIARNVGISFKAPVRVRVPDDRNHTWVESVRDSVDQMIELKTPAKIVVTMVPNDLKERYDAIKKVTCLEIGGKMPSKYDRSSQNCLISFAALFSVPNQVVNAMTFASGKNLSSIVTKIVLQV